MERNCWEYTRCGREPGGRKHQKLGVCPVTEFNLADGFLGGKYGGRACAFIIGSLSQTQHQSSCVSKKKDCSKCEFYNDLKEKHKKIFSVKVFNKYVHNAQIRGR